MNLPKLFKTSTFRLSLIYLSVFGASVLLLLGFIYWSTARLTTSQTDETIAAEITGLSEQYRRSGLVGLADVVRERSRNQRQSLYLLTDGNRFVIAGNLNAWPEVETQPGGWLEFPYQRPMGGRVETHPARARHLIVPGEFQLLVGRDIHGQSEVIEFIRTSLAWALALTLALGLAGGILMSRNLLRRVEVINRTSREIMAGELDQRIPVRGANDELDQLALNLNEMLDQIERLVNSLREVTDNIAHDLRTPLNRLRSRLEVTLMGEGSAEQFREALEATISEADDLLATFNALLNIAKAEAGQLEISPETIDLGPFIDDLAELYEPAAAEKGLGLSAAVHGKIDFAADRQLLSQALANLIDNAIKYSETGGAVVIRADRSGGAVEISVTDSGPGIPENDRERVTQRFVRLEASRNSTGSGLGLSLVRAIAHLHHGELHLEDARPGLRASLRLPSRNPGE